MVSEYSPIRKHKILLFFLKKWKSNKTGSLDELVNYYYASRANISVTIWKIKRAKYITYENTSSIDLTNRGIHNAEYFWKFPEDYKLTEIKKDLYELALLDGIYPDLLE